MTITTSTYPGEPALWFFDARGWQRGQLYAYRPALRVYTESHNRPEPCCKASLVTWPGDSQALINVHPQRMDTDALKSSQMSGHKDFRSMLDWASYGGL